MTNAPRVVQFHSEGVPDGTFDVSTCDGTDAISTLYRFDIELVSKKPDVDFTAILSSTAWLGLKVPVRLRDGGSATRLLKIHGMVCSIRQLDPIDEWSRYQLALVPRLWHLSTDDVRYDLTHGPEFDGYALTSQLVVVSPESGGPGARIAFPRTALEVTEVREGQPVANYWTTEQWAAFYDDIGDVQVRGATITVPTNRDYTATITLTDGEAVVTLDD